MLRTSDEARIPTSTRPWTQACVYDFPENGSMTSLLDSEHKRLMTRDSRRLLGRKSTERICNQMPEMKTTRRKMLGPKERRKTSTPRANKFGYCTRPRFVCWVFSSSFFFFLFLCFLFLFFTGLSYYRLKLGYFVVKYNRLQEVRSTQYATLLRWPTWP